MPKIQAWQEQAREMTGFYDELERNSDNIQKFFDKRGLKYAVSARIKERGRAGAARFRCSRNRLRAWLYQGAGRREGSRSRDSQALARLLPSG